MTRPTRRAFFATVARGATAVLPLRTVSLPTSCAEMDWQPFGQWVRHEHTDTCPHRSITHG